MITGALGLMVGPIGARSVETGDSGANANASALGTRAPGGEQRVVSDTYAAGDRRSVTLKVSHPRSEAETGSASASSSPAVLSTRRRSVIVWV